MIVTQARFLLLYPLNNLSFYREIKSDSIKAFLRKFTWSLADFGILTSIDMIFQPIHNLQSRFVLQNLQPNYRQYYSIAHAFSRHPLSELYRGSSAYIPINIIRSLTLSLIGLNSMEGLVLSFLLNHIITYPLTTVQRVMECQSHSVEGMIYKSNSEKKSNIDINN